MEIKSKDYLYSGYIDGSIQNKAGEIAFSGK